jgi:hypothetical protein
MYINRMADEQITHVINDMARPGYVLVSIQMGKTNLLLHTKDTMQDATHVFVYIDFSTMSGYDEKECLNTIIDTAIETNLDIFAEAEQQINNLRSSGSGARVRGQSLTKYGRYPIHKEGKIRYSAQHRAKAFDF